MITPADVAELAYAEVLATRPRTPERRAAVSVYVCSSVGRPKTVDAVRRAIADTYTPAVQAAALELLDQLLAITEQETTA